MAGRNANIVVGLTLGALLAGGCGGGTHTATAPAAPPRYVAEGNAICARQLARLDRLPHPTTPEQTIAYLPSALTAMRNEIAGLRVLDPPGAARSQLAGAMADTKRLSALLAHLLHELQHGTVEFAQLGVVQSTSTAIRAQLDARFRRVGLTSCAH